jgi:hypothetical protein
MQVLAPLGTSAVALAAHTQQPAQRLLVDEYTRSSGGSFSLQTPATELATYLNRRSMRVALVPDVPQAFAAAATAGRPETGTTLPNSIAGVTKLRSMQSTNNVLMVAPTAFGFNEQAAQDNSFMHAAEKPQESSNLTAKVREGFGEPGGGSTAGRTRMRKRLQSPAVAVAVAGASAVEGRCAGLMGLVGTLNGPCGCRQLLVWPVQLAGRGTACLQLAGQACSLLDRHAGGSYRTGTACSIASGKSS